MKSIIDIFISRLSRSAVKSESRTVVLPADSDFSEFRRSMQFEQILKNNFIFLTSLSESQIYGYL